jgi:hypothetical protein
MFWEFTFGLTEMLPLQFVIPFPVGWWLAKRKCNPEYLATRFLVFAISPVASYTIVSSVTLLAVAAVSAWSVLLLLLMGVVPGIVASVLYWKSAKGVGWGRKWLIVSCLTLATLPALLFMPLLLMFVAPTAVASLLYCKIGGWSGVGRKWMFVSCIVLAVCAATQCFQGHYFEYYASGQYHSCVGLMMCITLAQLVVPLAIGWWFIRHKRDQGQPQLAS